MHELPGYPKDTFADRLLTVSESVGSVLMLEIQNSTDSDELFNAQFGELQSQDELLHDLMFELNDGWGLGMEDEDSDFFSEGYVTTYQLLTYQEREIDSPLPGLTQHVYDGYLGSLRAADEGCVDYLERTLEVVVTKNEFLVKSLCQYIVEDSSPDIAESHTRAFLLGGINLYDVLYRQAKINDYLNDYHESAGPDRVILDQSTLRNIIVRTLPLPG